MTRAQTYNDIKPLVAMCKDGRLFDVQKWISAGGPVDLPDIKGGRRNKSPLEMAIEKGFHSLVQVLLEAHVSIDEPYYNPLEHALELKRLDLVKLLVNHGADIHTVDLYWVFQTWDTKTMDYFVAQGADFETYNPLANAFCEKIRTALGFYKRHKDRFPSFQEQLNIGLRHHCRRGNLKWISLMLWAGADPYARGPAESNADPDPEWEPNALEYAVWRGHFDVFDLKQVILDPAHPEAYELLHTACGANRSSFLKKLLEKGFKLDRHGDGGTFLIQTVIQHLDRDFDSYLEDRRSKRDIDTYTSRDRMKMIHLLVRAGAKWRPDAQDMRDARRSFLKMDPKYTAEFVWIMIGYHATNRENLMELIRTPAMKALIENDRPRIDELIASIG